MKSKLPGADVQTQLKPEALARKYIDRHLVETGWALLEAGSTVPHRGNFALKEEEINGRFADYVLYIDGSKKAIVEAKKEGDEDVEYALVQAIRRYANPSSVHFVYAANTKLDKYGNTIINLIFRDLRIKDSRSRVLFTFHTARGLQLLETCDVDSANLQLFNNPSAGVNGGLRYYQAEAINAIDAGLYQKKQKMLVHMATGTGKTRTVVELVHRFLSTQPKRFKRILFLVDRRELANQAMTAFASFDAMPGRKFDELYEVYTDKIPSDDDEKTKYNSKLLTQAKVSAPKEGDAHVYVTTIQRLYQQITGRSAFRTDEDEDEMEWEEKAVKYNPRVPIDAFDLIISDECHRSIYNLWELVLNYFDSVQIGLTATPTGRTFVFFDRNLVYRYGLQQATEDGFLVDYDPVRIFTKSAVTGAYIPKQQRLVLKDRETGYEDEEFADEDIPIEVESLERSITVPDRLRKLVAEFKKYWVPGEKTLVFAKHDNEKGSHADALVKAFREELGLGNDKVIKITYKSGKDVRTLIKKFRNSTDEAWIVVTVDLLSTGVDIPRIQHIVLDRIVQSRVLFEQMMGRGTRTCKEIGKTHFTVYDSLGTLELHKSLGNSAFSEDYVDPSKSVSVKKIVDKINRGIRKEYYIDRLVKRIQRIAKKLPPQGIDDFAAYAEIPNGDLGLFASSLKENLEKDFRKHFTLLKDDVFLEKLETWTKFDSKKLLIATDYEDYAVSEQFFKTASGDQLKPDDYIESFVKYVRDNEHKVDALELLLKNPELVELKHLKDLAKTLRKQPECFSVEKLNRAIGLSAKEELKNKSGTVLDLVSELISYIKYAEDDGHFHSIQERVDAALAKTLKNEEFSVEQLRWFNLMKDFVITRLKISKEDINSALAFRKSGGYVVLDKVFKGHLNGIIAKLNEAMLK